MGTSAVIATDSVPAYKDYRCDYSLNYETPSSLAYTANSVTGSYTDYTRKGSLSIICCK